MCSVTLALAGLSTGLQVAGQYQQSRAQAASLEAQADAARQNAAIQGQKSLNIAEQARQQQVQMDNKRRLVVGQQNAERGAVGLAGGVGSALDIYNATNDAYEQDSLNLLTNQRNATHDSYIQQVNYRNQEAAYRSQASAAKTAGNIAMFGTLLSGAASMYGMKSAGGGGSASTAAAQTPAAQTPTAAGYVAQTADNINSGISGTAGWIPQYSTGSIQGVTQTFGTPLRTNRFFTLSNNGRYF